MGTRRRVGNMQDTHPELFRDEALALPKSPTETQVIGPPPGYGVLPSQHIHHLIQTKIIASLREIQPGQIQPASLDLRLGAEAYRVRASFLPGSRVPLAKQLRHLQLDKFSLKGGAVLERGSVYVVQLQEAVKLPRSISAVANPKSSTGRLDVFVRLISENSEIFDYVEPGYAGNLYAEISPRSFSIKVREGSRLNQIRFRQLSRRHEKYRSYHLTDGQLQALHEKSRLVEGKPTIRNGLNIRVNLIGNAKSRIVGWRAKRYSAIVDVDEVNRYRASEFWDPISPPQGGRLMLDPLEFYILASRESLHIPPSFAAEMVPIDPAMGEFRVHYAGFFDPGFGHAAAGGEGSKGVLEVRSHEVPFFLEDGQIVARLVYEPLVAPPQLLYGENPGSNYQSQALKLSKHFYTTSLERRRQRVVADK